MANLQGRTPFSSDFDKRPDVATRIRIKEAWSDSWQTVDYLDALGAEALVSPGIGQARLLYKYGSILNAGYNFYRTFSPQELDGKLVQIQSVSSLSSGERTLWTGEITSETTQVFGDDVGAETGDQIIVAYEMPHIMDRFTIERAYFEKTEGVAERIGSFQTFNRRAKFGLSVLGNRSSAKVNDVYVFSTDGAVWTNRDIVEYLLGAHSPPGMSFRLTGQADVLDTIIGVYDFEGMSLFKALNILVDRHRAIGWRLIPDGDGANSFEVFTLIEEDISVGDITVPGNENIIDNIAVDGDRGINASITYNSDGQFDEVLVKGSKIRSCFTTSILEGTLEIAWTTAEEGFYLAVTPSENNDRDAERQTDKHLRVYQSFRIPRDWDGESDTGTPATHSVALPTVNDDGTIDVTAAAERFMSEKMLARAIPIETAAAITGAEPEYKAPIVAFPKDTFVITNPSPNITVLAVSYLNGPGVGTVTGEGTDSVAWTPPGGTKGAPVTIADGETKLLLGNNTNKYVIVTRTDAETILLFTMTVTISRRWDQSETIGANVKMLDSEMGFSIQPSINHILGYASFLTGVNGSQVEPVYDYHGVHATIAYDTDEKLLVRAKVGNFEDIEEPKTLTIEVPDATLWYLTPGTMVGVTDGAIVRDAVGGILRDDSERLRQIAALALSWYGERRAILKISYEKIFNPGVLGSYVRSISDSWNRRLSGTVITSVSWNFESGQQQTGIETSFENIRFEEIVKQKDVLKIHNQVAEMARRLGNLQSRIKGGGGGSGGTIVNTDRVTWNEGNRIIL